jgi:hypothetical protein
MHEIMQKRLLESIFARKCILHAVSPLYNFTKNTRNNIHYYFIIKQDLELVKPISLYEFIFILHTE